MNEKLSIAERKYLLEKLAKKPAKSTAYGLSGKHNRKSLEKVKTNTTNRFKDLQKELKAEEAELARLTESVESKRDELKAARKDIMDCHDSLRNMDFAGANEIKFGKDADDVSYACDGKWVHYDLETGNKDLYSKWKKAKNPDIEIIEESDDAPIEMEEVNNIEDPDGVDVTV